MAMRAGQITEDTSGTAGTWNFCMAMRVTQQKTQWDEEIVTCVAVKRDKKANTMRESRTAPPKGGKSRLTNPA